MKNRERKQFMRKGCALFFAAAMLVVGIGAVPITGEAAATPIYGAAGSAVYEDVILYEESTAVFRSQWNTEGTAVGPTKEGYVFGGWCSANGDGTYGMLTAETAAAAKENNTEVYAKYVPAYVLSVRAQVDTATYNGTERTEGSIRLVSATDSKEYQKVGFDVRLGGRIPVYADENNTPLEAKVVYSAIQTPAGTSDATTIFGTNAKFLSVWKLTGIAKGNDAKFMEVTPYWITMDGTKVSGLTKYVHMEDGYKSNLYISVPVTLRTENAVAAGAVTVAYPEGLTLIGTNAVEQGNLFDDGLQYKVDETNRTICIVADAESADAVASGLYVNLRFQKVSEATAPTHWEFIIDGEQFCNWNEDLVDGIHAWDIQY